jgi:polysaccharide chain length determinant protein (PEP-CTERM system associated)
MKDISRFGIGDYLAILWKRRPYFLITAVLVIAGMSFFAWWMPDIYRSETRITAVSPFVSEDWVRPAVKSTPEDQIISIREQLQSRSFLEGLIERHGLFGQGKNPNFKMENAVRAARNQIGIEKSSNNTVIIYFMGKIPREVQKATQAITEELVDQNANSRKKTVIATDDFFDEQLRQAEKDLKAHEETVKKWKTDHMGELPEQTLANMNTLSTLRSQLNGTDNAIQQAREQLKSLDYRYQERKRLNLISRSLTVTANEVRGADRKEGTASSLEVELASKKTLLSQYLAKYTPNYPDVILLKKNIERLEQQIRDRRAAIDAAQAANSSGAAPAGKAASETGPEESASPEAIADASDPLDASFKYEADSINAQIARREKEKEEIQQQIKNLQARLNLAPSLEADLTALTREEGVLRGHFGDLQSQKFKAQMASTVEQNKNNQTYKIIDPPNLPDKPVAPNRLQLVLIGIGAGLVLGFAAAIGREIADNTISGEDEAKTLLNIPVLASISTIPKERKTTKSLPGRRIA